MNIGVDLRSLGGEKMSGVKVYILSLLEEIFRLDKKNHYFLWWNSSREDFPSSLKIPNSPRFKVIHTRFSNRILNLRFKMKTRSVDEIIFMRSGKAMDVFFLPNPNPIYLTSRCKLITTIHDLSPTLYPKFFSRKSRVWLKFLNPQKIAMDSRRILTPSKSTQKDLSEVWKIPTKRIRVTPLASSSKLKRVKVGNIRKKYKLPKKFILALSTLEPRKNLQTLIHAFLSLKRESNFPHELVLGGEFDNKIFAKPKIINHESRITNQEIHLIGFVKEEDKAQLLSASDVFCFPSLYEGFGIPPLEAMKCGVATLVSDIPSLREVCGNGVKLLPPQNSDAWKVALQKVLREKNFREDLEKRGLAQAKKFSWKSCAKATLKVFDEVK